MSTLESNQIVSGQAVDNTLQLNKQGGGRIDIPLPKSDLISVYYESTLRNRNIPNAIKINITARDYGDELSLDKFEILKISNNYEAVTDSNYVYNIGKVFDYSSKSLIDGTCIIKEDVVNQKYGYNYVYNNINIFSDNELYGDYYVINEKSSTNLAGDIFNNEYYEGVIGFEYITKNGTPFTGTLQGIIITIVSQGGLNYAIFLSENSFDVSINNGRITTITPKEDPTHFYWSPGNTYLMLIGE